MAKVQKFANDDMLKISDANQAPKCVRKKTGIERVCKSCSTNNEQIRY